ncbi:MAG: ribosome-associated toxin RatA of RatAB toxin-antitoxin module [Phenylobacterium sp.]|jgi:ribosome-associated toxin RatA of RatAB toxin-antitoxin module
MPQISRNALVMYSTKAIFDLVNDIEQYPVFLPHCAGSKIIEASDNEITASVNIKKGPVNKTFTTKNTLIEPTKIIMELVDGPFRQLNGQWVFTRLDDHACKIELTLQYEFSSKLVEMAFGSIFKEVSNNLVLAFTQRAKVVYG